MFQKEKQGQLSFAAKQSGGMQKEVKTNKKKIIEYNKGIFVLSVTNTSRNVHPAYENHS